MHSPGTPGKTAGPCFLEEETGLRDGVEIFGKQIPTPDQPLEVSSHWPIHSFTQQTLLSSSGVSYGASRSPRHFGHITSLSLRNNLGGRYYYNSQYSKEETETLTNGQLA